MRLKSYALCRQKPHSAPVCTHICLTAYVCGRIKNMCIIPHLNLYALSNISAAAQVYTEGECNICAGFKILIQFIFLCKLIKLI